MVVITFQNADGECIGFTADGHAGYADAGQDIICAAVSALTQGSVAALEGLSSCVTLVKAEAGHLECRVYDPDIQSQVILAGLELALEQLVEEYSSFVDVRHG